METTRTTVTAIDDHLDLYESRDLSSRVVAKVPKGAKIQLGAVEQFEGREWIRATLDDGSAGFVLGPSARSHTTLVAAPDSAASRGRPATSTAPLGEVAPAAEIRDSGRCCICRADPTEHPIGPMRGFLRGAIGNACGSVVCEKCSFGRELVCQCGERLTFIRFNELRRRLGLDTAGAVERPREATGTVQDVKDEKGWLVFSDRQSAFDAKAKWEKRLQSQESSYHPTGNLSRSGWIVLPTLGAGAGVGATILGGCIVALACGYIASVVLRLDVWLWGRTIGDIIDEAFVVAPLLALACLSTLPGLFGGLAVRGISHAVKNRNVAAAGVFGGASGGVGAFLLCRWALPLMSAHLLSTLPELPSGAHSFSLDVWSSVLSSLQHGGTALWISLCLCVIASGFAGAAVAGGSVKSDKFCEACAQYMDSRRLSFLSLEDAAVCANAIKGGNFPSTVDADMATEGYDGPHVAIFQCDRCKAGYAEVEFAFRAKWQIPNDKGKVKYGRTRKRWLVASAPVTAEQITNLKI